MPDYNPITRPGDFQHHSHLEGDEEMTEVQRCNATCYWLIAQLDGERAGRRLGRIAAGVLIVLAFLAGTLVSPPWAPRPAHATVRPATMTAGGSVDVCVLKEDLGRSWTRGLEKKANRRFHQRIEVHRVNEDHLGRCEVVVWKGGRVALDYISGQPASNPRYHVYTGPYAMADAEVNVGSSTPRKARVATLLAALKAAGVR